MGATRQPRHPKQQKPEQDLSFSGNIPSLRRATPQNRATLEAENSKLCSQVDAIQQWLEVVLEETLGELDGQSVLIPGHRLLELKAILEEQNED